MPPTLCTSNTKSGRPCRAWALHDTDPPTCIAHHPRKPPPETTHGFYSSAIQPDELAALVAYADDLTLDDEIACARVALRRALNALTLPAPDTPDASADFARLAAVVFAGTRTVARLLKDQRILAGDPIDGVGGALAEALAELADEWEIEP